MKTHSNLSILKGVSLAGVACAAFAATCLSLTSCGGGGEEGDTPAEKVAVYLTGRSLILPGNSSDCTVQVLDSPRGSSLLNATIKYGADPSHTCWVQVIEAGTVTDDVLDNAKLVFSPSDVTMTQGSNFKAWWGLNPSYSSVSLVKPTIALTEGHAAGSACEGKYNATVESFSVTNSAGVDLDTSAMDLPTASGTFRIQQD